MKILILLFSLVFSSLLFAQEQISSQHLKIKVLAPEILSSSEESLVGLFFEPEEHWHVYWKNPGDSGTAPKFNFTSDNAQIGPIQWPYPQRLPLKHLTNLGYEGSVAYLFTVKPKDKKQITVSMDLEWLVCKEECIPGFAKIQFKRAVHEKASEGNEKDRELIRRFAARIPSSSENALFQISEVSLGNETLAVKLNTDISTLDLFPVNGDFVLPANPTKNLERKTFTFKTVAGSKKPESFSFVAVQNDQAWEFSDLKLKSTSSTSISQLLSLIFFAMIGGLILNLMPCVFPVISIKAFSLLKEEGATRRKDCFQYSLGVMTTFVVLGGIFLALRSAGQAVGWGFQLQSPLVILALAILFWLMALNFLGAFELGTSTMNFAGKFSQNASSFGSGVLSVFVAAPCTGPFMGTALGAAVTLPAISALLIFLGLGFGLALPFLLFAIFPKTLSWLPRPGAWMEKLKEFFAFPLFCTVIWLLWILGQQSSAQAWLLASTILLLISFAIWLGKNGSRTKMILIAFVTLIAIGMIAKQLNSLESSTQKISQGWQAYDEKILSDARASGQAIFVDFTAAWCITCQVNKQAVLDTEAGQAAFEKNKVLLMRADWTRQDPIITAALARLGRSSVPVYAFYPADGSAVKLLPQILTLSMIENINSQP